MTPTNRLHAAAAAVDAAHVAQRDAVAALVALWPDAAWKACGAHSPVGWLQTATGCSLAEARRLVRLAELCAAHPVLDEAVSSGTLSLGRAELLGRYATADRASVVAGSIDTLVTLGRDARTDDEFAAGVRFWAERADELVAPSTPGPHRVVLSEKLFGGGRVDADLHPAAFATVAAAFDAWTQDPDPADAPHRRTLAERRADAFDDLANFALTHGCDDDCDLESASDEVGPDAIPDDLSALLDGGSDDPLTRARERIRASLAAPQRRSRRRLRPKAGVHTTVVIDLSTLAGHREQTTRDFVRVDPAEGDLAEGDLAEGDLAGNDLAGVDQTETDPGEVDLAGVECRSERWALTRRAAEQLLCDANLSAALFAKPGRPIDATHASPRFTPRQRAVIAARDRGCVFPTCHRPSRHCDLHHLHPVEHGGPSTLANAATLCRYHHRLVHHGWTLDHHDDDGWRVTDPDGAVWTDGLPDEQRRADRRLDVQSAGNGLADDGLAVAAAGDGSRGDPAGRHRRRTGHNRPSV